MSCSSENCTPDFECEECVHSYLTANNSARLESSTWKGGVSTMERVREFADSDSAGKSRSGSDNSATEKQIAFIAKLCAERGQSVPEVKSKREAQQEIERLLELPVLVSFGRWAKVNGQWVVRIAGQFQSGDEVIVRKSSGEEQQVCLDELLQTAGSDTFWSLKKETGAKSTVYEPGMYRTDDDEIVKVKMNRAQTSIYGSVHNGDEWVYTPGITRKNLTRLTVEEAAAYGKLYGQCIVCCRELTNPESIERGIGPVCINKI